jgi:hypothetical protein
LASSISGVSTYYSGGGSSADYLTNSNYAGGLGGGGVGKNAVGTTVGQPGANGVANTGGGGGASGNGGSGIVIIRYAGTTQRATGGTVSITGGYVIHFFTSSGTFTA